MAGAFSNAYNDAYDTGIDLHASIPVNVVVSAPLKGAAGLEGNVPTILQLQDAEIKAYGAVNANVPVTYSVVGQFDAIARVAAALSLSIEHSGLVKGAAELRTNVQMYLARQGDFSTAFSRAFAGAQTYTAGVLTPLGSMDAQATLSILTTGTVDAIASLDAAVEMDVVSAGTLKGATALEGNVDMALVSAASMGGTARLAADMTITFTLTIAGASADTDLRREIEVCGTFNKYKTMTAIINRG